MHAAWSNSPQGLERHPTIEHVNISKTYEYSQKEE